MKSYNPFKMWGSWLGTVIYPLILMGSVVSYEKTLYPIVAFPYEFIIQIFNNMRPEIISNGFFFFIMVITALIEGFLIGWAIHSLVRKLRR